MYICIYEDKLLQMLFYITLLLTHVNKKICTLTCVKLSAITYSTCETKNYIVF